jgi:hypothetical protein
MASPLLLLKNRRNRAFRPRTMLAGKSAAPSAPDQIWVSHITYDGTHVNSNDSAGTTTT